MKKTNQRKGFTIVELVIVIAVIAILAAVLIPTFGSVVKDAQDAALKSNANSLYTEYGLTTINVIGTCARNDWSNTPQIIIEDFEIVKKQEYYF